MEQKRLLVKCTSQMPDSSSNRLGALHCKQAFLSYLQDFAAYFFDIIMKNRLVVVFTERQRQINLSCKPQGHILLVALSFILFLFSFIEVNMSTIRQCRKKQGLTQKAFAELFHVDQTSVSKWELGKSYPDVAVALRLSSYFGISLDRIFGNPLSFGVIRLPVQTDAGTEKLTDSKERVQDFIEVSYNELSKCFTEEELLRDRSVLMNIADHFFAMRVNGDSMKPRFLDGDIVIVKKQSYVESGRIAAVCSDNKNTGIYKVKWQKKGVDLISQNPAYDTEFVTKSDYDAGNLVILGPVVRLHGNVS